MPEAGHLYTGSAAYLKRTALRQRSARQLGAHQIPINVGIPDLSRVRDDSLLDTEGSSLIGALGPIFEEDIPIVTDTSSQNFFAAVDKRVNYLNRSHATDTYLASMDLLDLKIPKRQEEVDWTYELFEEWNSHNAPGKQKRMILALDSFPKFTAREYGAKDVFTKVELLLKAHDPEWAGRLVNNSTDLHNAISGPILQACTKRLNYILDNHQDGNRQFVLGYGTATTDKVTGRINTAGGKIQHVVECDFSSNDMMQVEEAQLCEAEWLYRLGAPRWLTEIMVQANVYKVYNRDFNFSATVSYQLPSGSTSTTFRNCVWNMSIFHQWVTHRSLGEAHGPVDRFLAFFLGDDMLCIVFSSKYPSSERGRKKLARTYEYITKCACMKGKVKVHEFLGDAEFLSKHFVPTSNGWRMFPKIGRALSKINIRVNNNPMLTNEEYMLGKLLSYAWEYKSCPQIRDPILDRAMALEGRFSLSLFAINEAAFTYNYLRLVREIGQSAAAATISVPNEEEIGDDDFGMWIHYRYGWSRSEFDEFLFSLLFGEDDIPRSVYEPLAARDFRS